MCMTPLASGGKRDRAVSHAEVLAVNGVLNMKPCARIVYVQVIRTGINKIKPGRLMFNRFHIVRI